MSSRGIARRIAGAVTRATAVAALLFILAVPVAIFAADPSAPPTPGGSGQVGQTSGETCDTHPQLPPGVPNMVVPKLPMEACTALGYKDAGDRGLVDGYATLMTFLAFASMLWLLFIIGKLAWEMISLFLKKDSESGLGTEEKAGALFGHFSRQLIASFIVAIVGFVIFSNGIQIVLAIGNGGIGILGVSSNGSYLLKFGGPLIGGVLLWMQNAGSMVLLLVAVPIAAFRFLRAYSKITLGAGGAAAPEGDFAAINSHLKSTFYFLVAIALCWIGIRFGIDIVIGLWTNISGGSTTFGQ